MLIIKNNYHGGLDDFEEEIKVNIPTDYKQFIEKYNGGDTPNTKIQTKHISTDVRVFYGIGNKHDNLNAANCFTKENNVFLPIASDSFGNEFALCIKGDEKGIWFYDHEASPDKKMTLVSNTFNEFINCCESEPISEAAKRTPEERERILIEKGKSANITDGLKELWKKEYEKYQNCVIVEIKI